MRRLILSLLASLSFSAPALAEFSGGNGGQLRQYTLKACTGADLSTCTKVVGYVNASESASGHQEIWYWKKDSVSCSANDQGASPLTNRLCMLQVNGFTAGYDDGASPVTPDGSSFSSWTLTAAAGDFDFQTVTDSAGLSLPSSPNRLKVNATPNVTVVMNFKHLGQDNPKVRWAVSQAGQSLLFGGTGAAASKRFEPFSNALTIPQGGGYQLDLLN